ncbi:MULTISPECIES: hypothetical protein [unclassified Candidatus Tisiphia]
MPIENIEKSQRQGQLFGYKLSTPRSVNKLAVGRTKVVVYHLG